MNTTAPSTNLTVANNESVDIFANEETILKALGTIRHSAVPTSDKDNLRDLFLNYVGTNDETKRLTLKAEAIGVLKQHSTLATLVLGVANPDQENEALTAKALTNAGMGRTRPVPTFISTPSKPIPVPEPSPAVSPPAPEIKSTVVKAEAATPQPVPVVATPTPVAPAPTPTPTVVDPRQRINEIKFSINKQVGNPVNLIEADEKIGREYMMTLLDAMKRSAHGDTDLTDLEASYRAALNLIREKDLAIDKTAPETEIPTEKVPKEITPTPDLVPPVAEPVAVEVISEPQESSAPILAPAITSQTTPEPSEPTTLNTPNYNTTNPNGLYHKPMDEAEAEALLVAVPKDTGSLVSRILLKKSPALKTPEASPVTQTTSLVSNQEKESDTLQPLTATTSTLDDKMLKLKTVAKAREEAAKKPITDLKSPEVEAGLKQLLSEWVLFRSNGLFRTGPSGINHPLYKKLAPLPMAAVVAGRFEGVTPDIKHNLSDYMTGWRYEQGVLHEMGETFEHYLRRVIKQILERQRTVLSK